MSPPTVTAVIATYKRSDDLRTAIGSAVAQTYADLEILVSDNANDPEIRWLAESFGDSRVRYRSNARNLGPAGNHWAAMREARGKYIAILNDDDLWQPGWLATAVPVMDDRDDAVLVFCDHDIIDPAGRSLAGATDALTRRWGRDGLSGGPHRPFTELVARQTLPIAMGCLFRRDAIDLASLPDVGPAYDLWLGFALCRTGGSAYYIRDRLTAWRVHPGQITGTRDEAAMRGSLACWQAMAEDPTFRPVRHTVRRRLAEAACSLGVAQVARGDCRSAAASARLAIRSRPVNWRAWAVLGLSILPRGISRGVTESRGYQS